MPGEPNYYDSQAVAAAALGVTVYDVKAAKRDGCQAFRSGRVYRAELEEWFKAHPVTRSVAREAVSPSQTEAFSIPGHYRWKDRRELLFEIREFLDDVHTRGEISAAEYRGIGNKTVSLILELGRAWDAAIDEPGYRRGWAELRRKASGKLIRELAGASA